MNDFSPPDLPRSPALAPPVPAVDDMTQGGSSIYRLFEAFIALREKNERQHKLFEQTLAKSRDVIQASFNSFAQDTQRAYQQLRQEVHGEKRISLVLLNELMEIGFDLEQIVTNRPRTEFPGEEGEALLDTQWSGGVAPVGLTSSLNPSTSGTVVTFTATAPAGALAIFAASAGASLASAASCAALSAGAAFSQPAGRKSGTRPKNEPPSIQTGAGDRPKPVTA